MKLEYKSQKQ